LCGALVLNTIISGVDISIIIVVVVVVVIIGDDVDNKKTKKALTYKEAITSEEVAKRGIDLVPRLVNILKRRGAACKCRTTDSEWEACETELGFGLPPDYKLLCNTIGTTCVFGGGTTTGLKGPNDIM
jgi:hypothetical protein